MDIPHITTAPIYPLLGYPTSPQALMSIYYVPVNRKLIYTSSVTFPLFVQESRRTNICLIALIVVCCLLSYSYQCLCIRLKETCLLAFLCAPSTSMRHLLCYDRRRRCVGGRGRCCGLYGPLSSSPPFTFQRRAS